MDVNFTIGNELTIRAFWAVDDHDACERFIEEHTNVLKHYGVTNVTTARPDWMYNPKVVVLLVESVDGVALAGARIHLYDKNQKLPFEEAIEDIDPSVKDFIIDTSKYGTGEICGLWNAKAASGLGLATIFIMRAGIALTQRLGIGRLLAFCAEHTLDICEVKGFEIVHTLGDNGCFHYPKEDYVARAIILMDTKDLSKSSKYERKCIMELRAGLNDCSSAELKSELIVKFNHNLEIKEYV